MNRGRNCVKLILLIGAAGCLLLTGCGKKKADSVAAIQEKGSFQVAFAGAADHMEKTERQILETELALQIGDALGVETVFNNTSSQAEAMAMVASGQADMAVGSLTEASGDGDNLNYSVSYQSVKLYVVTARGDYSDSPAAFAGRSLITMPEFESQVQGEGMSLTVCQSAGEGAAAILQDQADGLVCSYEEGILLLWQNEGLLQMQNMQNTRKAEYVVAVRKEDGRLLQGINTIIDRLLDGEGSASSQSQTGRENGETEQQEGGK